MKVRANGILINYELVGSGRCLVLIHGAGDNHTVWFQQIPAFSQCYRVLAYDVRGHGDSEGAEPRSSQETWADDLCELLQVLNIDDIYLLGHSMGGGLAATFAVKYPQMVRALVLANSYGIGPYTEEGRRQAEEWSRHEILALGQEGMEGVYKLRLERTFSPGVPQKNPALMARYKAMLLRSKPESYRQMLVWLRERTAPNFAAIRCPTLILVGELEIHRGPEAARVVAQTMAQAEIKTFPTGHGPHLECPEEYNKVVLEFLARRDKET